MGEEPQEMGEEPQEMGEEIVEAPVRYGEELVRDSHAGYRRLWAGGSSGPVILPDDDDWSGWLVNSSEDAPRLPADPG